MVKVVDKLNINIDLIKYLDELNMNYGIAITDTKKCVYNNKTEYKSEISSELKNLLEKFYNNKVLNLFLKNSYTEKNNINYSNYMITDININNKTTNKFVEELIFTKDKNISLFKYDNFEYYFFKCVIPIKTDFFKGSLIVCSMDDDESMENKESFLRFSIGLYYIVKHYIANEDYNKYNLLK